MADAGHLFVVGGAEDRTGSKLILRQFVDAAGGKDARIVVVATASSQPREVFREYEAAFDDLGVREVFCCSQEQRSEAQDPELVGAVERATGVYITGGDQLKLVTTLGGTALAEAIRRRHATGLVLGGTSAGASAMSAVMIGRGMARKAPRLSSVRLSPGLGVLDRIIVDQHFQERDRLGRLIAAVLRNPDLLGFGVDEDTAFIRTPSGMIEIAGAGTVSVVDGAGLVATSINDARDSEPLAFSGMAIHVLRTGWGYDLRNRRVILPESAAADAPGAPDPIPLGGPS